MRSNSISSNQVEIILEFLHHHVSQKCKILIDFALIKKSNNGANFGQNLIDTIGWYTGHLLTMIRTTYLTENIRFYAYGCQFVK